MDILRVVACFMVVTLHVMSEKIYDPWDNDMFFVAMLQCICQPAVPLFFMLSGAFSNDTNISHYLKKIAKFLLIYIVFKVFYAVADCLFDHGFVALYLLNWDYGLTDLKTFHFHLWYLFIFSNILLLAPVINSANKQNKNTDKYLTALFFIFCILRPKLQPVMIYENVNGNVLQMLLSLVELEFSTDLGYFCMGKAVHNLLIEKKDYLKDLKRSRIIFAFSLILWMISVAYYQFETITYFKTNGKLHYDALNRSNPAMCFSALFLFATFELLGFVQRDKRSEKLDDTSSKFAGIINILVPCTLGIYILHPFFIDLYSHIFGFTVHSFDPALSVPLKVILVFASCIAVVLPFMWVKRMLFSRISCQKNSIEQQK